MSSQRYTASKSLTKGGTAWIMSFRHPLRKDPRGKQGRKVRRGLHTSEETRAQELIDQMNDLLKDTQWHSITKRSEAERRFDSVVVDAFYDSIESTSFNSWEFRNKALPLPTPEKGYAKVMLVGTTGAGKTSLLRHLIGSHPKNDRFPSTSASRTTISDIEVITSPDEPYRAVVTFFDESTIHTNVHECVAKACADLWDDLPDDKVAERLLMHRDLRFRLGYIIGSWKQVPSSETLEDDGWDWDSDEDSEAFDPVDEVDETTPTTTDIKQMQNRLESYLDRIRKIASEAKQRLRSELDIEFDSLTGPDKEAAQDLFEDLVQECSDFDDLVNDIMEEVKLRLDQIGGDALIQHPNGWPLAWKYDDTDRASFISKVRRFSSNYAPAFGTLLTPLVDGIRIQGPFFPTFTDNGPRLVLLDGEGLGHVTDPAAGVTSRITKRFTDVDVVLLVDSAKAPMLDAPTSVLRQIAASGYQKKLAFAFTHFDLVRGQANLPTLDAQRAHVLAPVRQKLTSLREDEALTAVRPIERELEERCFMLGFLDRVLTEKNRGPVSELNKLIEFCEEIILSSSTTSQQGAPVPVYDTASLERTIQAAARDFHSRWNAILGFAPSGNVPTAHWTQIKALNRRIVLDVDNCEYRHLKPVADFVRCLSESITTKFLARPSRWDKKAPTDQEKDEAISRVQREVFDRLDKFVDKKILRIPQSQWQEAFDYRGHRSTRKRASEIRTIYETSAPPEPMRDLHSEQFLREVCKLVHEAIHEGKGKLANAILSEPQLADAPEHEGRSEEEGR